MQVLFDTRHLYYLPQYLPVAREFERRGIESEFIFYRRESEKQLCRAAQDEELQIHWVNDPAEALTYYLQRNADWVFFGNSFDGLDQLHHVSRSAQLGHGIGPKSSYYTKSSTTMSVRFVEGAYRTARLHSMYPDGNFINAGFAKLDPLVNGLTPPMPLESLSLDVKRKTLLYAPTFYPSSIECFPADWPQIFSEYNILIKPHHFSFTKSRYVRQRQLLEKWALASNVYLAEQDDYSLLPFMATADLLISDASSALFEFAAINRPVIWCDFLKLRWSYRGPFRYRFRRRLDQDYGEYANIAAHAKSFADLKELVDFHVANPGALETERMELAEKLAGTVDGNSSKRIVDYIMLQQNNGSNA